jgi:hypothetical protein
MLRAGLLKRGRRSFLGGPSGGPATAGTAVLGERETPVGALGTWASAGVGPESRVRLLSVAYRLPSGARRRRRSPGRDVRGAAR